MILCIEDVLNAAALAEIRTQLEAVHYENGAATAGWHARTVKRNLQLAPERGGVGAQADAGFPAGPGARVWTALREHGLFRMGVLPKSIRPPIVARYEVGMAYGPHVDDALMGPPEAPVRTDVAVTVFLCDPEDYDGGELVVETTGGEQAYKLPAGAAIAYPANTLHRVEEVTRGVRSVAVSWVQSLVREPARRELLFELDAARRSLFDAQGKTREFDLISKSYANLLRMWAEP